MSLVIYNSLTREKEEFIPPEKGKIGIYVCGPTVYDEPHIGHARSAYIFDVIVKYLRFKFENENRKIVFVRNVTDIDDKIIDRARREPGEEDLKEKTRKIAERYLNRYHEDMGLLGLDLPNEEPKATETIDEMISFIQILIDRGFAYTAAGNVYFDVRKFDDYGRLSGQGMDEMVEGVRVSVEKDKKDPLDFALWKAAKPEEPSWPSPWGTGRPGWHIECSVMSTKLLGEDFVIHGGGLDLIFPHHENEIAQTVCAGKKSARYWIHNGLLTINGQKMSKSLGNFISIRDFQSKYKDLDLLKLFFLSNHYRHPADYTEEKIEEMKKAKERIIKFLQNADTVLKNHNNLQLTERGYTRNIALFKHAMSQDIATSFALGLVFGCVEDGNKILQKKTIEDEDYNNLYSFTCFIKEVSKKFFNLNLEYEKKKGKTIKLEFEERITVRDYCELKLDCKEDKEIFELIEKREIARKNNDYKTADEIRMELFNKGIIIEDTKKGPVCRRKI